MLLSGHVHCVTASFKMAEWVEQRICIKFCIKLKHSPTGTIWVIQKATAMGSWWLAASSHTRASCLMQSSFGETSNHPDDSASLLPGFAICDFLLFPKLKSPLKEKRFQTVDEIQENIITIGRTVWSPKVPTLSTSHFEGDGGIIVLCTIFLCIFYLLQ